MADYCFGVILIARGKNGVYCAKRLKTPLTKANFTKMKSIGAGYKGKNYDTLFQWSDNKMYCSELLETVSYAEY